MRRYLDHYRIPAGVRSTADALRSEGIAFHGINETAEEAGKARLLSQKGIVVAVLWDTTRTCCNRVSTTARTEILPGSCRSSIHSETSPIRSGPPACAAVWWPTFT